MNKQALANLDCFTGTQQYHSYSPRLVMTDGAKHLCDNADCYWLMDVIGSYQPIVLKDISLRNMQFWSLRDGACPADIKNGKKGKLIKFTPCEGPAIAYVQCERDSDDVAIIQEIGMTDFPFDVLPEVKVWVQPLDAKRLCAMIPSEY